MKYSIIYLIIGIFSPFLKAQELNSGLLQNSVRKGVIYKNEKSWDFAIQTNGFHFGYTLGKIKTYYKTSYTHFDFGLVEHSRESKVSTPFSQQSKLLSSYTYGKQYSLWNLRASKGGIRYLSEKTRKKGLAVGYSYEAGMILGLLKPYYLLVTRNVDGRFITDQIKYSNETKEDFLDEYKIEGASSFRKGLSEIKIRPGANFKLALRLDPGAFEKYAKSLELGVLVDMYATPIQILVTEKKEYFFINFFAKIQLGKRF
ncbi:MAG: hypothetical protein WAS56_14535 [Saprospiraceae bacterium]